MIKDITEVNFPSYATLSSATVNLNDMGENTITAQIKIDGDVAPDFSYNWIVRHNGMKYVHPYRKTQASKTNESAMSTVDLTFYHWVAYELKRYFFVELASVGSGTMMADKYIATVSLNLADFVTALNNVLLFYYRGRITAKLNPSYQYDNAPTTVEISYTKIWELVLKLVDLYGVRWQISENPSSSEAVIKIGYETDELDHVFEYGFEGGLLKYEQQVQSPDIKNVLLGNGGDKNLPHRYFKKHDENNPSFTADPDWIPELANIHFDRLLDINFRRYVQGWKTNPNRDTLDGQLSVDTYNELRGTTDWAYAKGHSDELFDPVKYVKDDDSIAKYGEIWDGLADNDDIYPTIQGVTIDPFGRIDEAVDVEQIESDDIQQAAESNSEVKSVDDAVGSVRMYEYDKWYPLSFRSVNFYVPANKTAIIDWQESPCGRYRTKQTYFDFGSNTQKYIYGDWVEIPDEYMYTQDVNVKVFNSETNQEVNGANLQGGDSGQYFYLLISANVKVEYFNVGNAEMTGMLAVNSIRLVMSDAVDRWTNTFNVWVKNIWGSTKSDSETAEGFASRIWRPILGDKLGNEAKVVFSDGFLSMSSDYEFVIVDYAYDTSKTLSFDANGNVVSNDSSLAVTSYQSMWRLKLAKSTADLETLGVYVPSTQRQGKAGDHFFFIGIDMPHMYVVEAEKRLNAYKTDILAESSDIVPPKVITFDKVRAYTKLGEETNTFISQLNVGAKIKIYDKRFIVGTPETQYVKSITFTYSEPSESESKLLPDIEVTLSNKVEAAESTVSRISGEVQALQKQIGAISNIETLLKAFGNKLYLRKDGAADASLSPTTFSSLVTSNDFRQGRVGGAGWGIYRDAAGNTIFEADRMVLRQTLDVTELAIHHTEWIGGSYIESAAGGVIESIELLSNGNFKCYLDLKDGTESNMFAVGDVAYSQQFKGDMTRYSFYKRRVMEVGDNYVILSNVYTNGSDVPSVGDTIIQYGNYTDAYRQYVKIRDVVGGGYERFLEGLNSVDAVGKEYYFIGKEITTSGSLTSYRLFIGDKDNDYLEWKDNQLSIRGKLIMRGSNQSIEDYIDDITTSLSDDISEELMALQAQIDGVVSSWSGEGVPTKDNYPASGWTDETEQRKHIGDVYTDSATGYSYKWFWNSPTSYGWVQISDSAAAEALRLAKMSVMSTDVLYQATDSADTAPTLPSGDNMNGWETTAPQWQLGKYIWTTTKTKYGDDSVTYSNAVMISGKDGRGVLSITEEYYLSTSATALLGGSWSVDRPTWVAGKYYWTRSIIAYSDSTTSTTTPMCVSGANGANGTSVLAQYSADASSWHTSYQDGDVWMRTSTDSGQNWTAAVRIVGSNYSPNLLNESNKGWSNTDYPTAQIPLDGTIADGETVTLQIWGVSTASNVTSIGIYNSGGNVGMVAFNASDVTDGYIKVTFNWVVGSSANDTLFVYFIPNGYNGQPNTFEKIMLTRGTDVIDWTPSATDMIGADGRYTIWQWAKNTSTDTAPTSGWQDEPINAAAGEYVWMRSGVVVPPQTAPTKWSTAVRLTGDTGERNSILDLSNENVSVPCDSDGNPTIVLSNVISVITVFDGYSVANDWNIAKTDIGCTSSLSGNVITLESLTDDFATITIQASKVGYSTLTAVMSISKVRDGGTAVVYSIDTSVANITKAYDGTLSADSVTATKYKTTGSSGRAVTTDNVLKYQRIGVDETELIASGSSVTASITDDVTAVIFTLYDSSTNEVLDRERVPVLSDASGLDVGSDNMLINSGYWSDTTNGKMPWGWSVEKSPESETYDDVVVSYGDGTTYPLKSLVLTNRFAKITNMPNSGATIETGKTYTVIFDIYKDYGYRIYIYGKDASGTERAITNKVVALSNTATSHTFTSQYTVSDVYVRIQPISPPSNGKAMAITYIGLYKGNAQRYWSPCPQDAIVRFDYIGKALEQDTEIEGGLIQTSLINMGYTDSDGVRHVTAGSSGLISDTANNRDVAFWAGGKMIDPDNDAENASTFGVRMDGSVWAANNIVRMDGEGISIGKYVRLTDNGLELIVNREGNQVVPLRITDESISEDIINNGLDTQEVSLTITSPDYGNQFQVLRYKETTAFTDSFKNAPTNIQDCEFSTQIIGNIQQGRILRLFIKGNYNTVYVDTATQRDFPMMYVKIVNLTTGTDLRGRYISGTIDGSVVSYEADMYDLEISTTGDYAVLSTWVNKAVASDNYSVYTTTTNPYSFTAKGITRLANPASNETLIGNNGILSIWGNNYLLYNKDIFKVMVGSRGIRLDANGFKTTSDSGTTWE